MSNWNGLVSAFWLLSLKRYILNNDGTLNWPSNPAATGSAITIFAAGAGQYTHELWQ